MQQLLYPQGEELVGLEGSACAAGGRNSSSGSSVDVWQLVVDTTSLGYAEYRSWPLMTWNVTGGPFAVLCQPGTEFPFAGPSAVLCRLLGVGLVSSVHWVVCYAHTHLVAIGVPWLLTVCGGLLSSCICDPLRFCTTCAL
jgi:hypothetical protein